MVLHYQDKNQNNVIEIIIIKCIIIIKLSQHFLQYQVSFANTNINKYIQEASLLFSEINVLIP